jgi:hypothetical protein
LLMAMNEMTNGNGKPVAEAIGEAEDEKGA